MIQKVFISGISGFIGRNLAVFLSNLGYQVHGLSRNPGSIKSTLDERVRLHQWLGENESWINLVDEQTAFIHLAGHNISSGRWTLELKKRISQSRILTGNYLVQLFRQKQCFPTVFMQASAVGYYGDVSERPVDESTPLGKGFLAQVAKNWENSTRGLDKENVRRYILRIGVVLSKDGGALPQLMLPYKLFIGSSIGKGNQGMSWIHLEDLLKIIEYLFKYDGTERVFNVSSPRPVSNIEFCKTLGKVVKRPCLFRVPDSILRILLGEMGRELILNGAYVQPVALQNSGYKFNYPELEPALKNLLYT